MIKEKIKDRIDWIDVAKAFGIFMILLGHFGSDAGPLLNFVFIFHVPLFFFLSGCVENNNKEINLKNFIIKNIKGLIIPTFFFCILSLFLYTINFSVALKDLPFYLITILKGCIKNKYIVPGVWFFTCLFVIRIMFYFIKKIKYKWILLLIGLGTFFIARFVIKPSPIVNPSWIYNIDSAIYYLHYYIMGYILYPHIEKLLKLDNIVKKVLAISIGVITFIYTFILYQSISLLCYIPLYSNIRSVVVSIIDSYIAIIATIMVAYVFRNVKLFKVIGINTLYICGNEFIIRLLVPLIVGIVGLDIQLTTPLATCIYTFILIIIIIYVLIPIEKPMLDKILKKSK